LDFPCQESRNTDDLVPFKGNMDLVALRSALDKHGDKVSLVMVTVTNNAGGGQPVSLDNLRGIRALCDGFGVPFYIDACRFAENAWFIKQREAGQQDRSIPEIVTEMFSMADGCTMSAKKDGMANIGGFLACRDSELAGEFRRRLVVTEGFPTYGGLAGRDLEAVAQGLREVLREDYLNYRTASIQYVVERLYERGIPVLRPAGGHAIFLDAARFLDHIPWNQYPGQSLAAELYLEGGIRSCEIGTCMLGGHDPETGEEIQAQHELVRLAIPRRTYTQSHMDYVIEIIDAVWRKRKTLTGTRITEAPPVLRHFSAHFASV
jgi:tryptophanase